MASVATLKGKGKQRANPPLYETPIYQAFMKQSGVRTSPRKRPPVKPLPLAPHNPSRVTKAGASSTNPQQPFVQEFRVTIAKWQARTSRTSLRRSFTREEKLEAIALAEHGMIYDANGQPKKASNYQICKALFIEPCQLRAWIRKKEEIEASKKNSRKAVSAARSIPSIPLVEQALMMKFIHHRMKGFAVTRRWFKRHAVNLFRLHYPDRCDHVRQPNGSILQVPRFAFSEGWFTGMRKRNRMSYRKGTKKSSKPPDDAREKIIAWLQFNRRAAALKSGESIEHDVGRFKLCNIANMDQTPLEFDFPSRSTYTLQGSNDITIRQTRSGWEKRMATLQVTVFADGIARIKPCLIFHGSETESSRRKKEKIQYDPRVYVLFNDAAYCNERTQLDYAKVSFQAH